MTFSGKRVRQARELRGLTQTELADKARVSQGLIADIERGFRDGSHNVMSAIASQTRFPLSFFSKEPEIEFSIDSLLFRARASATRRQLTSACRYAELIYELFQEMSKRFTRIPLILPKLLGGDPNIAAQKTRAAMGLPSDQPIVHLVNSIEKAGVIVLPIPAEIEKEDAFAHWVTPDTPTIAAIAGRPGDRSRFSVAHELGHIVLQHSRQFRTDDERIANVFAAEFLMPESAMRREVEQPVTLSRIAELKPRWGVAIQALVRRAFDLKIVTERQYRYLFEQIGSKKWRTNEPLYIEPEKPRALRQMLESVYGHPIDYYRLASDARLRTELVKEIVEGYAGPRETTSPRRNGNVVDFKRRE